MSLTRGLVLDVANQLGGAAPNPTVLHDWSREQNDGAFLGAGEPAWAQSAAGSWVMDFDGVDDYVGCGNDPSLHVIDFSCEFWAYSNDVSGSPGVISHGTQATAGWHSHILADGRILFRVHAPAANEVDTAAGVFIIGGWRHIVFVKNGVTGYIYYNGVDVTDASAVLAPPVIPATPFYIGTYLPGSSRFPGYIGNIRFFNYALTPAQIRARYHSTRWLFGSAT